ncbi:MAG: hypothetical protein MJD61_20895 [Proteobacteria bacterium]|nr:hypothetical protein [Pseudomonadota bacterium]
MGYTEREPDWYTVTEGRELEQGDYLPSLPVPLIHDPGASLGEGDNVRVEFEVHNVCVLTQSCNLVNKKAQTVMLGRVLAWADLVDARKKAGDEGYAKEGMRKKVQQGLQPALCLLHRRRDEPGIPWSVVDFHTLFVLSRKAVETHAASIGKRLRLESPYREHLSQAFARYFMRVGLPHDARAFLKDPN